MTNLAPKQCVREIKYFEHVTGLPTDVEAMLRRRPLHGTLSDDFQAANLCAAMLSGETDIDRRGLSPNDRYILCMFRRGW